MNLTIDNSDTLTLCFEPECNGAITMCGKIFSVKCGESKIPLRALPNGECRPILEADTGRYILEGFVKSGSEISMLKTEEATIRRLLNTCLVLEKSRSALEDRVSRLEALCVGHNIFNYERKEK